MFCRFDVEVVYCVGGVLRFDRAVFILYLFYVCMYNTLGCMLKSCAIGGGVPWQSRARVGRCLKSRAQPRVCLIRILIFSIVSFEVLCRWTSVQER